VKDGKRKFLGDPRAATPTKIMLRALAVSFVMLLVGLGPCAAQTKPPAIDIRNDLRNDASSAVANQLPNPHSISAAGAASTSNEDAAAENELLEAANKSRELAGAPQLRMDESCTKQRERMLCAWLPAIAWSISCPASPPCSKESPKSVRRIARCRRR
jgi:hypothetical protein